MQWWILLPLLRRQIAVLDCWWCLTCNMYPIYLFKVQQFHSLNAESCRSKALVINVCMSVILIPKTKGTVKIYFSWSWLTSYLETWGCELRTQRLQSVLMTGEWIPSLLWHEIPPSAALSSAASLQTLQEKSASASYSSFIFRHWEHSIVLCWKINTVNTVCAEPIWSLWLSWLHSRYWFIHRDLRVGWFLYWGRNLLSCEI